MPRRWASRCILGIVLTAGCQTPTSTKPAPPLSPPARGSSRPVSAPAPPAAGEATPTGTPRLAITDRAALTELERGGFDFRGFVLGLERDVPDRASDYRKANGYRALVEVLERDLREAAARDRMSGVGLKHAHRLFDARWLSSQHFHFELVGVVNRLDRRVFASDYCGEIRFVYRLAYDVQGDREKLASRVPMTVNFVRWVSDDCAKSAKRWQTVADHGPQLAKELILPTGPLHPSALAKTRVKSIEVDLQNVRWPATVRPNMTGHAEYVLRVFSPEGDTWRPALLENTPDVNLLKRRPALLGEFVEWLRRPESLAAVDTGTAVVPEKFLTTRAVSVAPHGLARLANRPFRQLLTERHAKGLDLSKYQTFNSFEQLVRRLDGLTCMGCHQTRSLAGFHLLGESDPKRDVDALAVPFSPHFVDELERRERYLASLAEGGTPDEMRPPPERMRGGGYGAHCGLDATFASWTCDPGLACMRLHDQHVGQCMPTAGEVGDACEAGTILGNANGHRDYVRLDKPSSCGSDERYCERSGVGFPSGMCSSGCTALSPGATCGGIALLTEFNECLARRVPFETCVREHTRPGALRACSQSRACRDDYVCARLPDGTGGCIPPYFLFQLRVDGHAVR